MAKNNTAKELEVAAAAALELATRATQTAEALAKAKVTSDTTAAVLAADIGYIKTDISEIKQTLKDFALKDTQYVLKDDFNFWRNILVSGLLLTLAVGVISNFIK